MITVERCKVFGHEGMFFYRPNPIEQEHTIELEHVPHYSKNVFLRGTYKTDVKTFEASALMTGRSFEATREEVFQMIYRSIWLTQNPK